MKNGHWLYMAARYFFGYRCADLVVLYHIEVA